MIVRLVLVVVCHYDFIYFHDYVIFYHGTVPSVFIPSKVDIDLGYFMDERPQCET